MTQVAQLRLDLTPPHLDRVFDYLVPEPLADRVRQGIRVRVRFHGRLVNGFVVGMAAPTHTGSQLRPIERVISDEVVLTPDIQALVEQVAERQAGTFADVVRSAVPPRHARAEASLAKVMGSGNDPLASGSVAMGTVAMGSVAMGSAAMDSNAWDRYRHGPGLLNRLQRGEASGVRAVFSQAPGAPWTQDVAALIRACLAGTTADRPGQVVVVVPDVTDVERLKAELDDLHSTIAVLTSASGPEQRYRSFLRALRGHVQVIIGTRAAVFAPVPNLQLLVVWDDQDESLIDPQAPYWHARDVAALRAHLGGAGLVIGGPSRSVITEYWVQSGWATSLTAERAVLRTVAPRVTGQPESSRHESGPVRISHAAWTVLQQGLRDGPVLVQVRRAGYVPGLACMSCRAPALCSCGGVLSRVHDSAVPMCSRCAQPRPDFSCPHCKDRQRGLRALSIGAQRTAEEFGRAFPQATIVWSQGSHPVRAVPAHPAVVVSTPGAEPVAQGGYRAVVLLDAMAQLRAPYLDAEQEAARRWFSAALLARPTAPVVVSADSSLAPVQALLRWDAPWLAQRQLQDLREVGLGPEHRFAAITGSVDAVDDVIGSLRTPARVIRIAGERALVGVPRSEGLELARELGALIRERSARKGGSQLTVVMDPREPLRP